VALQQLAVSGRVVELLDAEGRSFGMWKRPTAPPTASATGIDVSKLPVMTRERAEAIIAAAKAVGDEPLFDDHV
jgi:hypothetical protein